MQPQVKKSAIIGLFGEQYGNKLINWLNPCNPSFCAAVKACNASSPFNIGVEIECNPSIPSYRYPALHRSPGAQLHEVRRME